MAVYLTNTSEITSIADAIRSKTGTSATLEYPSGFVSAINGIESGPGIDSGYLLSYIYQTGSRSLSYTAGTTAIQYTRTSGLSAFYLYTSLPSEYIRDYSITTGVYKAFPVATTIGVYTYSTYAATQPLLQTDTAIGTTYNYKSFSFGADVSSTSTQVYYYTCSMGSKVFGGYKTIYMSVNVAFPYIYSYTPFTWSNSQSWEYNNTTNTATMHYSGTLSNPLFYGCSVSTASLAVAPPWKDVEKINLDSEFYTIASFAFYACNANEISAPGCRNIRAYAFRECPYLSKLYLMNSSKATLSNSTAFYNTPFNKSEYLGYYGSIYVPSSLLSDYQADTYWSLYADRLVGVEE